MRGVNIFLGLNIFLGQNIFLGDFSLLWHGLSSSDQGSTELPKLTPGGCYISQPCLSN